MWTSAHDMEVEAAAEPLYRVVYCAIDGDHKADDVVLAAARLAWELTERLLLTGSSSGGCAS